MSPANCVPSAETTSARDHRRADPATWRAEAAENSSDKLLVLYDEALATERDDQRRRNTQSIRGWLAAGNPIDSRDSSMRSYDAVLAELPALLAVLDDENSRHSRGAARVHRTSPGKLRMPAVGTLTARTGHGPTPSPSIAACPHHLRTACSDTRRSATVGTGTTPRLSTTSKPLCPAAIPRKRTGAAP